MNDSIENSLEDSSSLEHVVISSNSNTVKANILLDIQKSAEEEVPPPPVPAPEIIKFKFRCILDDLKASLRHRKYSRLLYKTVLIQLIRNRSERLKSKLWDNLIKDI